MLYMYGQLTGEPGAVNIAMQLQIASESMAQYAGIAFGEIALLDSAQEAANALVNMREGFK